MYLSNDGHNATVEYNWEGKNTRVRIYIYIISIFRQAELILLNRNLYRYSVLTLY